MKLYNKIMTSSIYTAKNNGFMSDIWKFTSNFYMSAALASNLLVLCVFIHLFIIKGLFNFLPLQHNRFVLYTYFSSIPLFTLFNYYAFFLNNKYEILVKKYKANYNKKAFTLYFIISFILSLTLVFSKN